MSSFKCPECGTCKVASNLCVSTDWSTGGEATSPWSYVLQQIHCANCDEYIPSHLGERWDNMLSLIHISEPTTLLSIA